MANDTALTIVGNLTADPELRYTQNGVPVTNFTVASTPRTFDRQKGEFVDGEALFMRCSVWREMAENIAASLRKGNRVVVTGLLKQRSYQDREGQTRSSVELDVDEVGPSLRFAIAHLEKAGTSKGGGAPQNRPPQPAGRPQAPQQPQQAPAYADSNSWDQVGADGGYGDEQPF